MTKKQIHTPHLEESVSFGKNNASIAGSQILMYIRNI